MGGGLRASREVFVAWFSQALIVAERLARAMRYALARRATLPKPGSAVFLLDVSVWAVRHRLP